MKRTLVSLTIVSVLLAIMAVPVMAVEQGFEASVTVNEVIDVTISDTNDDGIKFGMLAPGDVDKPDIAQSTADDSVPAVTIIINPATNIDCDLGIRGTDFDATIPINNASFASGHYNSPKIDLSTNDVWFALNQGGGTIRLWHFLSIPADAAGGTHTCSFTYSVVASPHP